tara:strand:- start:195 stop:1271 length:1077 start_codon:yes stop_codon:yes gene_type:complete
MAKSDLLKEAIADAKAVKETALANAKIALQEAFAPRIQSMLSAGLVKELDDAESDLDLDAELDGGDVMPADDMAPAGDDMGMDDMGDEGEPMDVGDIEIDTDMDGEIDFTGDIMSKPGMEPEMDDMDGDVVVGEPEMEDPGMEPEMEMPVDDDMGIEEIIRELEEDLTEDDTDPYANEEGEEDYESNESTNIDAIIEAILAEEDPMAGTNEAGQAVKSAIHEEDIDEETNEGEVKEELEEAYRTVRHLKSVINEVNLLNAKLLYTNKLFRNFELNESQKMKVIENFDRAANTREAKLVFATLAESFHKPKSGKKVVKESKSMASKPVRSTAPSRATTQVLTEGFEQANRWKKLAGLIK